MDEQTLKQGTAKVQQAYNQGLEKAQRLASSASEKSQEAFAVTDEWVRDNPWVTVGVIAGVGILLGFLLGRRRN